MAKLYPLQFKTIFKDKIWGGKKIKTILGKDYSPLPNCGETWEISGVEGNISVVAGGELEGKSLTALIEEYKDTLVGKKIYQKFGKEFPLLIKFLDANDDLSIQVHPDDELAQKRHNSFGKTEMWYILQADPGSKLNTGFKPGVNESIYLQHLENNNLEEILNFEQVKTGDVFFLPAGRVHYIGKGICLAEIQQTSDITYRIYDFDRKDDKGNKRELHTDLALGAIDYQYYDNYKTRYSEKENGTVTLVSCPYFTTNLASFTGSLRKDYKSLDSFIIYVCVEGESVLHAEGKKYPVKKGETLLIPASIKEVELTTDSSCKILEVYIDQNI